MTVSTDRRPEDAPVPGVARRKARSDRSFLNDISILHGPHDLLARFFIAADAACAELGIHVRFADLEELVHVNDKNRDSWKPLNPTFHPACGLVDNDTTFALLGTAADGTVVTAIALKLFDWRATHFGVEAETLRLLYRDPGSMAPPGASCTVTVPSASSITGLLGYSGASWVHPRARKLRLATVMSRAVRAVGYTRWGLDLVCGLTSLGLIAKGYARDNGYCHVEPSVTFANIAACPPEAGLVWIGRDEIVADLSTWVRNAVHGRRAHDIALPIDDQWQQEARVTETKAAS